MVIGCRAFVEHRMLVIQTRDHKATAANLRDPSVFSILGKSDYADQRVATVDLELESACERSRSAAGHDSCVSGSSFEKRATGSMESQKR